MNAVITKKFILLLCLLSAGNGIYGITVGSDSTVSRQAHTLFLRADADNEMNGFAYFEDGFELEDKNTSCTFDSFFPVGGFVQMHGGNLYLQKDLKFADGTILGSFGSVYGNGYSVELSESINTLTSHTPTTSVTQTDQITANFAVNSLSWSTTDGEYIAFGTDEDGAGDELFVYKINRTTGAMSLEDSADLGDPVYSVDWHPFTDYIVAGRDTGPGDELYIYSFDRGTSALTESDAIGFPGSVLSVLWYRDGNYLAVGTDSSSNFLRAYQFDPVAGTLGTQLSVDTQPTGLGSVDALSWDVTGSYLAVGMSQSTASDILIYYLQDSTNLTLTHQIDIPDVETVLSLDWSPTDSLLAVGLGDGPDRLRLYRFNYNPAVWTLEEIPTARTDETHVINSVDWNYDGSKIAVGAVTGVTPEFRIYVFEGGARLDLDAAVSMGVDVNAVEWDYSGSFVATGDAGANLTTFTASDLPFAGDVSNLVFQDVSIELGGDVDWRMTTSFVGSCVIEGNGHTLTFERGGNILVQPGAHLTLQNMDIHYTGLSGVMAMANSAYFCMKNARVYMERGVNFQQGYMTFAGDVTWTGSTVFQYSSIMTSTIEANSRLIIDEGMTFYYSPPGDHGKFLHLTDKSSILYLNGCTLRCTTTPIKLTRGRVILDNNVTLSSASTDPSEVITFGDGTSENDIDVTWLSGADLTVYGGIYDNNAS